MNKKQRFKSFDELSHALQRIQDGVAQRLVKAYGEPLLAGAQNVPPTKGVEDRFKRSLFGTSSGVPLRRYGLNE